MKVGVRVTLETIGIVLGVALVVAILLRVGWVVDFAPTPKTFTQTISFMLLEGFLILVALFAAFVAIWRMDAAEGQPSADLHLPLMESLGAIAIYFGVASIAAIDVFYHADETWPLLRDPAVRLITASLVILIVIPRAWLLFKLLRGRCWTWRRIALWSAVVLATPVLLVSILVRL